MSFDDAFDFYELFDKHSEQFKKASSYQEFCKLVGTTLMEHLANRVWAVPIFETAKAGKRTYHALFFPRAETFADLFDSAKFLPHGHSEQPIPRGYRYIGGEAGLAMHVGGKRSWSASTPNTRTHYGAKFYCTYVMPKLEIAKVVNAELIEGKTRRTFEASPQEDGILVLARDDYDSRWLALLNSSEKIETLVDEPTRQLIAAERPRRDRRLGP